MQIDFFLIDLFFASAEQFSSIVAYKLNAPRNSTEEAVSYIDEKKNSTNIYIYKSLKMRERITLINTGNGERKRRRYVTVVEWLVTSGPISFYVWSAEVISQASTPSSIQPTERVYTGQVINFPAVKHCPRWSVSACTPRGLPLSGPASLSLSFLHTAPQMRAARSRESIFDTGNVYDQLSRTC